MRYAAIALLIGVAAHPAAQQPATPAPSAAAGSFEVASIKPNKADNNRVNLNLEPGGRFVATNVSLQVLIAAAYGHGPPLPSNRMVLNARWIAGLDVYTARTTDSSAPSIFTAAREQLGLKLEPAKTSIDILVVDHAEHPTGN